MTLLSTSVHNADLQVKLEILNEHQEREREENLLRNSKRRGSDVRDLKIVENKWIRSGREGEK